jgi:signal transduction histidine kinase
MVSLRVDLVFSYWIYAWFILYELKITEYSPKFPLILGIIHNLIMLIFMLLYGTSIRTIFYFIVINTLIKVIPLYYLRNEAIKLNDIYFTAGLFLLFIFWLHLNEQSLVGNIKLIHDSLLYGKEQTPFMALLNKIKSNYKTIEMI